MLSSAIIRTKLPLLAVILAGVLWGLTSVFVRPLSAAGLTSRQIVLIRSLIPFLSYAALLALRSPKLFRVRLRDLWIFLGMGFVSFYCFNCCYIYVIAHGHAAVGGVLLYTAPAFIILLSALLFHERLTIWKCLAVLLILAGCTLISGILSGNQVNRLPFDILKYGIASGALYATYTLFGKCAVKRYETLTILFYTFLTATFAGCCCGDLLPAIRGSFQSFPIFLAALGAGLACSTAAYFLYTWGLARVEAGKAAIFVAVEPVVCAILGMCCYGENHSLLRLLGVATILIALGIARK